MSEVRDRLDQMRRDAAASGRLRRGRRRSLGSYLARTLLPRSIVFAAFSAALLVGNAMAVDPLAAPADTSVTPLPTWTAAVALAHPDCVDVARWPDGRPAPEVVAFSFQRGEASRVAFDRAWRLNHNETEVDDLWVLGVCPGALENSSIFN